MPPTNPQHHARLARSRHPRKPTSTWLEPIPTLSTTPVTTPMCLNGERTMERAKSPRRAGRGVTLRALLNLRLTTMDRRTMKGVQVEPGSLRLRQRRMASPIGITSSKPALLARGQHFRRRHEAGSRRRRAGMMDEIGQDETGQDLYALSKYRSLRWRSLLLLLFDFDNLILGRTLQGTGLIHNHVDLAVSVVN